MTAGWLLGISIATMAASFALTLVVRAVAPYVGLTDHPDGHRKLHGQATPLGGGLAVYLATAVAVLALRYLPNPCQEYLIPYTRSLLGMLGAALVIVVLGLADDRFCLRGRHKLVGQLLVALCLVANGLAIPQVTLLGFDLPLGSLVIPITVLWLLGAMNAINLLDGIDGLATVLGIILTGTFAVMAFFIGRTEVGIVALVFTSALVGFVWLNLPPAKIFLGDAGSMLIGLLLGILAIKGSMKGPGTALMAAPLAVWTLPILDSVAAILRRKLTGRSIYETDRGHLHHRLLDRLGSNVRVLLLVGGCCALTSVAAMVSVVMKSDAVAISVAFAVVAMFIATGLFGRVEFMLVMHRLRGFLRSFLRLGRQATPQSESSVHLQGSMQWQIIWSALIESADKLMLRRINLDLNVPMLHEGFNAHWERRANDDSKTCWHLEMPLMVEGQQVGQLNIVGQPRQGTVDQEMAPLLELVGTCESYLQSVIQAELEAQQAHPATAEATAPRRPGEVKDEG